MMSFEVLPASPGGKIAAVLALMVFIAALAATVHPAVGRADAATGKEGTIIGAGRPGGAPGPEAAGPGTTAAQGKGAALRGMYGVPGVPAGDPARTEDKLRSGGINAVFVPGDETAVQWFKSRGYKVFISVNAFGGRGPWKRWPDSRPVTAAGRPYGEDLPQERAIGGVCPTHPGWRAERLRHIDTLLKRLGPHADGIWLDFIRYPGLWERTGAAAYYPDTCYCPRCRRLFLEHLAATGKRPAVSLTAMEAPAAAAWIRKHRAREWRQWKQEQILSFVREVRKLRDERTGGGAPPHGKTATGAGAAVDSGGAAIVAGQDEAAARTATGAERSSGRPFLLGAFLVPWTKGEREGAVSWILGQDPFALGGLVDVVSPMVYHRMVGRSPAWVGEMTAYYRETMPAAVWPIIQSEDTGAAEFLAAVNAAAAGGADGILVYSYRGMKADLWAPLRSFRLRENLLPNPDLTIPVRASAPPGWTGCTAARTDDLGSRCFAKPAAELDNNPLVIRRPPLSPGASLPLAAGSSPPVSEPSGPEPLIAETAPAGAGGEDKGAVVSATKTVAARKDKQVAEGAARAVSGEGVKRGLTVAVPAEAGPVGGPGAVGIRAGRDGRDEWRAPLPPCVPGRDYLFSGYFYRDYWENGVYAKVRVWGREIKLDSHLQSKRWQNLRGWVTCPGGSPKKMGGEGRPSGGSGDGNAHGDPGGAAGNHFVFASDQAGKNFWMTRPLLTPVPAPAAPAKLPVGGEMAAAKTRAHRPTATVPQDTAPADTRSGPARSDGEAVMAAVVKDLPVPAAGQTTKESGAGGRLANADGDATAWLPAGLYEDFFPIGVYGAGKEDLAQLRRLGLNTVVIGGRGPALRSAVAACHAANFRYVLATPHDPDELRPFLDEIAGHVRPGYLAFYVNDEPEIRSAPVNAAEDVQRLLKDRYPGAATCMAIVRPEACRDYKNASDLFMMDQYPVIGRPMTILSDSLDRAARDVGRERLLAVVQAFREPQSGWPRLPSWEEMDVLAFLAVVHGSRGIFFYTYSQIGKTEEGRRDLARVAGRLNRIYPWLLVPNAAVETPVRMVSRYGWDFEGRPAVHAAVKTRGEETLLIAVNGIGAPVEAELGWPEGERCAVVWELFGNERYPVVAGRLRVSFEAYETKAFHCTR